jgi:hypothetical protein
MELELRMEVRIEQVTVQGERGFKVLVWKVGNREREGVFPFYGEAWGKQRKLRPDGFNT